MEQALQVFRRVTGVAGVRDILTRDGERGQLWSEGDVICRRTLC